MDSLVDKYLPLLEKEGSNPQGLLVSFYCEYYGIEPTKFLFSNFGRFVKTYGWLRVFKATLAVFDADPDDYYDPVALLAHILRSDLDKKTVVDTNRDLTAYVKEKQKELNRQIRGGYE